MESNPSEIIFVGHCPDRVGLVACITHFFASENFNILDLAQHSEQGRFFMRVEGKGEGYSQSIQDWKRKFYPVAKGLEMEYTFHTLSDRLRVIMFCSKTLPCPLEIISRVLSNDLPIELLAVISNHMNIAPIVKQLNIPFYYTQTEGETSHFEEEQLGIIQKLKPDMVVLARYMRIMSDHLLQLLAIPVINIHHSFLPSFIGKNPYEQAYQRGVKLIGATAHFVTKDLDEGPIISQDVVQIDHRFSVSDMKQLGADIEKQVLATALRKFSERKVIQWKGRTIVFH
ncbi:MAG: formyltetrahydrofolate deformylase [Magnetococcales bacterium]|nr:formyltetrahydrofolate deformylase [Magnetococcales bacterium]